MEKERPKPPLAGIIYGGIVYWGVLVGSLLVTIGSVLAFLGDNYVPVSYWLSSVWKGESVYHTWENATGSLPMGHWYLNYLMRGDGITAFGISLGVFCVVPALFLSTMVLFKQRQGLYGLLALTCGCIVMVGVLGLLPMP